MPPDSDDLAPWSDRLHYAKQVRDRVDGRTLDEFRGASDFRLATERRIEIIGEAARQVSNAFQAEHPHIPWRPIIAQRHILAHDYGGVIVEKIWRVATQHIPNLIEQLEPLVPEPPEPTPGR